jgi:hypothetical protein
MRFHQRSGLAELLRRVKFFGLLPKKLADLEPQTPLIADHFSDALIDETETPTAGKRYRVGLLTGCIQDLAFSDVNRATADVLLANGCEVITPRAQSCCGSLHAHNGAVEHARELARRQFREIARIAGLIVPSYPGQARSARSLQASSELFFDVFSEFDPQNMLLGQARREVMERQLEFGRMKRALEAIGRMEIVIKAVPKLTPFAFPLWVDRLRSQLSSEKVEDRIVRMIGHLEDAAGTVAEPEFADLEDAGELPSKARRGRRADGKTKAKVPWRRPRL